MLRRPAGGLALLIPGEFHAYFSRLARTLLRSIDEFYNNHGGHAGRGTVLPDGRLLAIIPMRHGSVASDARTAVSILRSSERPDSRTLTLRQFLFITTRSLEQTLKLY